MSERDDIKRMERSYYLSREHAEKFDRRSSFERSVERYGDSARMLRQFKTDGCVLDIGCATARMIMSLAKALPSMRFVGIDVSEEMIRLGQKNISEAGLEDRVELKALSAEDLGSFETGSFDAVQSHGAISGWLNPQEALKEVARILKPGGMFFLRDWSRSAPEDLLVPHLDKIGGDEEEESRVWMAYRSSYTGEELSTLLDSCPLELESFSTEGLWMTAVMKNPA